MILVICYLCLSQTLLFAESKGHFYYSWDSLTGFHSGFLYNNPFFQLNLEGLYDFEDFQLQSFQFKSQSLEIGSMALKGSLQLVETHQNTINIYMEDSEIETDRDKNPLNNVGILFKEENLGGIAAWKEENQSRIQGWLKPNVFPHMEVLISSAISIGEYKESSDSWFLEDEPLYSNFLLNNLLSLRFSEGIWQGGAVTNTSFAPDDSGGFSLSIFSLFDWPQMQLYFDTEFISEDCLFSDFKRSDYYWKFNNRISFPLWLVPSHWDLLLLRKGSSISLELEEQSSFTFETFNFVLNGQILLELHESQKNAFEYKFSGTLIKEWESLKGELKITGSKEMDIFQYEIQTDLSAALGNLEFFLKSQLHIDESVEMAVSPSVSWIRENLELKTKLSLDHIPLYNSDNTIEPRFIISLKISNPQP